MSKMKLRCRDCLNPVQSIAKARQNNDIINCIGVVCAEIETKISGPIKLSAVCYENQIGRHDRLYRCSHH